MPGGATCLLPAWRTCIPLPEDWIWIRNFPGISISQCWGVGGLPATSNSKCTNFIYTIHLELISLNKPNSSSTTGVFPLNLTVHNSWKVRCCGDKMLQVIQNMILSRGLQLKLSLLWRTTISDQHSLFLEEVQKMWNYVNSCSYWNIMEAGVCIFFHFLDLF